ncbi:pleckstrin homology domain-containing family A member 8 [Ambystoma mexicanum]|uniref:pleckstrin homology domain-containing family A member 8 n=1 Tax=Ambystoma mexicanum TaxID=8296 RepID=UPI0037E76314
MEGELHKWTNYYSGWQPRWFLLCGGILSYYDSREEAWKGSKGSIQMAVCEIQVHSTDSTRLDLMIPGQQRFYLRARTAAERQRWLVALGSAKACLANVGTKEETELSDHVKALKVKMAELRLHCDLLIQQLSKAKASAAAMGADSQEVIDAGVLLRSTCNAFLETLEECMQISQVTFNVGATLSPAPESHPGGIVKPKKVGPPMLSSHTKMERQMELNNNYGHGPASPDRIFQEVTVIPNETPQHLRMSESSSNIPTHTHVQENRAGDDVPDAVCRSCAVEGDGVSSSSQTEAESAREPQKEPELEEEKRDLGDRIEDVQTFFSIMNYRFNDIQLLEGEGIPTQAFLDACYAIVPVLDKLGSTVFAPVKMDFVGNIKKINQKFITQKEELHTLQRIVLHEVESNLAGVRNSATEALLWLKRGLKFLREFLTEMRNGEQNIHTALNNAYGKTLRQYHGWVVRGVFALALRAAPTYDSFAAALSVGERDDWKEAFGHAMRRDLDIYLPAMGKQLDLLDALYEEHNLESDEVV